MKFKVEYQATIHGSATVESKYATDEDAANVILGMLRSEGYDVTNFLWIAEPDEDPRADEALAKIDKQEKENE